MCGEGEMVLAQRQASFDNDFVQPMVSEARTIGIPMTDILVRIMEMEGLDRQET